MVRYKNRLGSVSTASPDRHIRRRETAVPDHPFAVHQSVRQRVLPRRIIEGESESRCPPHAHTLGKRERCQSRLPRHARHQALHQPFIGPAGKVAAVAVSKHHAPTVVQMELRREASLHMLQPAPDGKVLAALLEPIAQ